MPEAKNDQGETSIQQLGVYERLNWNDLTPFNSAFSVHAGHFESAFQVYSCKLHKICPREQTQFCTHYMEFLSVRPLACFCACVCVYVNARVCLQGNVPRPPC